jgi:hypothetical protein
MKTLAVVVFAGLVALTAAGASGSAGRTIVVKLKAQHHSGVSGTATLSPAGAHVRIVVRLKTPVKVHGRLPAHLHIGACKVEPNLNVQSSLNDVVKGRSTTVLKFTTWAELRGKTYSIHVHEPTYDVIACGDVRI